MTGRLTISLGALSRNYRTLEDSTRAEVAGVVKANAYGVGVDVVVPRLQREGCRTFFVATLEEGIRVRKLVSSPGADVSIYVLEGVLSSAHAAELRSHNLTPVINHAAQFDLWDENGAYAIHVDTGMERLGYAFDDGLRLLTQGAKPELILSHFARADEQKAEFTQTQVAMVAALREFAVPLSLSNSAGILLHDVSEDLTRAGIALYGGSPTGKAGDGLEPVVRLEGPVLQIRKISAGTPVGYGGAYVTSADETLLTVGVGYADGVPRLLSNQGHVWCRQQLPIVGRVSMDMVHVAAGQHGQDIRLGDSVEILGARINIESVASLARTLSYEVLTGLDSAGRLERVSIEASL